LGRRIYKSSNVGISVFAYDGDNLIEETNSSGAAVARYSQGLDIDEPLAMLRSSTTSYYQADGLGSVTSLTNAAGAVASNYTYDSFGNLVTTSGSLANNFRYTGREIDPETSLYNYRARYYDPASGRFLSEDPLRFRAWPDFYSYVSNSPVSFIDPTGLKQRPGTAIKPPSVPPSGPNSSSCDGSSTPENPKPKWCHAVAGLAAGEGVLGAGGGAATTLLGEAILGGAVAGASAGLLLGGAITGFVWWYYCD
jgi:RHS repeat-associated protein